MWRVLDERERADAVRVDTPGLVVVACDGCGAPAVVDEALLLVRSTSVAPVVVVLPREQLQEPGAVLSDLQAEVGDRVAGKPVLAPRVLLPLLLARDVDADASDPGRAADQVRTDHGNELADLYADFLALAVSQYAAAEPQRLLDALAAIPIEKLQEWLDEHPQASGPGLVALLDRVAGRANDASDASSAGQLRLMRLMLDAVAAGTPAKDAVATHITVSAEHFDAHLRPELDRLWAAANGVDADAAILALRVLLARLLEPDRADQRRIAAGMLAARLLAPGAPAGSVEEAIALLEEVRDSSSARDAVWATATGNLATAVGDRRGGDVENDWRRSVALLREALNADADERTTAINETNLGLALTNRPGGATNKELGEAIDWLARGLARRSPETSLEDWAYSKVNIGLAHRRRNGPGDLDEAIGHYRDAADRLRGTPLTRLLVYAELDLASALLAAEPPAAVEALTVAAAAVGLSDALGDPFLLGWALRVKGDAHAAVDGPLSTGAVGAWQRSIDALDPTLHPAQLLSNAARLATAYQETKTWGPLAALYEQMLAAFDALYAAQATSVARRHVLASYPRLARWAAYALARTGRTAAAIEALERARARELDVNARRDTADLDAVARRDPGLADRYRMALTAYRATATQPRPAAPPASASASDDEAVAAARVLQRVIDEIRAIPGLARFLATPTAAESLLAAGARQAIYIASAPAGTFVLGIAANPSDATPRYSAVHLDVTSRDVAGMLVLDFDTGDPGLLLAQSAGTDPDALRCALARLQPRLTAVVAAVAELAAEAGPGPSVLIPTGLAGLIPLQSLAIATDGTTLDDVAEVHLAPSLAIYAASRRRAARPVPPVLVGVADTDPDEPLPGSRGELDVISARPGWASVAVAIGADATLEWLTLHAPAASHLHLACHGRSDLADPSGSHLVLGSGDRLAVPALVHGIPLRARVAVASACQSAQYDASVVPDEHVGLAAGLLQAGAACAIVSLWPVSDEATALLMTRLYEFLDAGSDGQPRTQLPQGALRQARLWLRDLTDEGRAAYLDDHPVLADALRARGLPAATARGGSQGPYGAVEQWGAFVAYGC